VPSPLTLALLEHLVRIGTLSADDIDTIAEQLEAVSESGEAHACRMTYLQALAPTQSEWEAERRRKHMRLVPDES
jgi:hypothetical protein